MVGRATVPSNVANGDVCTIALPVVKLYLRANLDAITNLLAKWTRNETTKCEINTKLPVFK